MRRAIFSAGVAVTLVAAVAAAQTITGGPPTNNVTVSNIGNVAGTYIAEFLGNANNSVANPATRLLFGGGAIANDGAAIENYQENAFSAANYSLRLYSALSNAQVLNMTLSSDGNTSFVGGLAITKGYTVATLPAGVTGARAHVTNATACTFMGALTGGGAVVCPVFYNGTAWVGG